MKDASSIYDAVHLDVTIGPGFSEAETRLNALAAQVQNLQRAGTISLRVESSGLTKAIADAERLGRAMAGVGTAVADRRTNRPLGMDKIVSTSAPSGTKYIEAQGPLYRRTQEDVYARANLMRQARNDYDRLISEVSRFGSGKNRVIASIRELYQAPLRALRQGRSLWANASVAGDLDDFLFARRPSAINYRDPMRGGAWAMSGASAGGAGAPPTGGIGTTSGAIPPSGPRGGEATAAQIKALNNMFAPDKTKNINNWGTAFGQVMRNMGKVAMWAVATGAIYGVIHAFKDMLTTITAVDHAMADIRKVYQGAPSDLKPLRDNLINLSIEYGANAEAAMEAAVAWARLGLKGPQIAEAMRVSMLAMNIAEMNASQATDLLTAAMIQFKMPVDSAMRVLDSWNELSNRTRTTTVDLGESVSIAGATFQQTGDNIHYLNALTATLTTTMAKSGREVGNALRTIGTFAYRPKTTKALKEIAGIDVRRGQAGPQMPGEADTAYIKRQKDDVKSLSEILSEAAGRWSSLTKSQQINLGQAIAGARRYNYFVAIMENYDAVMKNLLISMDSAGSSERENAIYMDTLQKKTDQLKAAFTKLYVSAGEGGVAGILKTLTDTLTKLITGMSGINIVVPIATVLIMKLAQSLHKAYVSAGGVDGIMKGLRSTMGVVNLSILAVAGALTVLESAAAGAKKRMADLQKETDDWISSMDKSVDAVRSVSDSVSSFETYRTYIEKKYKPGTPEYTRNMEAYNRALTAQARILAANSDVTENVARSMIESGHVQDLLKVKTDERLGSLDEERTKTENLIDSLKGYSTSNVDAANSIRAVTTASEYLGLVQRKDKGVQADIGMGLGVGYSALKSGKNIFSRQQMESELVGRALAVAQGKLKSIGDAQIKAAHDQLELATKDMEEIEESAGGAGKEIDYLQQMLDKFATRMRELNDQENLANHLLSMNQTVLDQISEKYGDVAYNADGYISTLYEQKDIEEGLVDVLESKIAQNQRDRAELASALSHGAAAKEVDDAIGNLDGQTRQYEQTLLKIRGDLAALNNTEFNTFITLMERQTELARRGEDLFSRVLPSSSDAIKVGRDLGYINRELDEIGKKTGKDITGMLERAGIHTTNITYNMSQWQAFLDAAKLSEAERAKVEELITKRMDIQLDIIEKQVEEYRALSDSMRSIVDDGLWGIITGEQTALDLAKQIGLEYGKIAVQTFTGPATEGFAAGLGGAAYMLKTGRALPTGASLGIENAMVTDGALHVRDDALAAIVAQGGGQGIGTAAAAGLGGALGGMGGQGVGRRGAAGGSIYSNAAMPYIGGALSGGIMGSGGGMAGAAFGAGMGSLGVYLSTLGPWGMLAGAGVTMLSFLGNLFGRGGHATEEDTYARRQANGMGERSVSIGSAGTVQNNFYMTITYESSTDRENVRQLFDLLEDEATTRGAQVSGNVRQAAV